jgi:alpha-L-rhamnosidase
MGLLKPSDWQAQWIGLKGKGQEANESLAGNKWIWFPEGSPLQNAPAAERYFRVSFDVPAGKMVSSAYLLGAVDNSFQAYVNGQRIAEGSGWQSAPSANITDRIRPGKNVVAVSARNTDGPAGFTGLVRVNFTDGNSLRLPTDATWKSHNARLANWQNVAFDDADWKPAMVFATVGDQPWGVPDVSSGIGGPAPLLRKTFTLDKPVKEARVYVTALGSYRLHINGKRVGNDILTPDWTDYRKHARYQVYDVTKHLKKGDNAAGAILGDGWYGSGLGWNLKRYNFGEPPSRLLLQMHVEYADGTTTTVGTDGSWRATDDSPVRRSEIYAGETYDARKEQAGWDTASFRDGGWRTADVFPSNGTVLVAQQSPTIQITQELKPKTISEPKPGVFVLDMGQNMVGMARLNVRGPAGTAVRMRFAERLQPDGTIYTENLRRAEATDTYTLRGDGTEVFEPHFTYHGFQYVELTGYPGKPTTDAVTGLVFHTNTPPAGRITTSDEMVNQLLRNIDWGLRGNLHSVPTDCPQRDERLGWMGDAQIFWSTACYFRDVASFTHKWMLDVVDAQSAEGGFPDVAPRVVDLADGAPAWGDAGVIVPYEAYRHYGDTRIIEDNWAAMEKWMNYIHSANPDLLWLKRRNNDFGDWVPANSETPKDLIGTAYWAYDAKLMSEMARAVGRESDARKYADLYQGIKAAFQKRFVKEDGTVGNGSQTCYALAFTMDLLPQELKSVAMNKLVADIERRGGHLSTGFIGTPYLMPTLTRNGRNDVAYRLLLNKTYPSWGYTISKGATTIWERWNGDTGDPGMNSFNHYAFGAVGDWLYRYVGGIDQDPAAAGFKRIVIRPRPAEGLTSATAEHDSVYGTVKSTWEARPGGGISLAVTVPANTSATVYVPAADKGRVTEGGRAINDRSGVRFLRMEDGCAVYAVEAGSYRFTAG